jgi:cyclic pyranopterin phosphate synthase
MQLEDKMLNHLNENNDPTMVDVSEKNHSVRSATAQTVMELPEELLSYFSGKELILKKGPVFQTAIIAGTMAVKRTHEMIPFCHQIPVESCKFDISLNHLTVTITCKIKTTFKTGVEMEALHGATVAALTIYDMCKAVSHNILIKETKLLSKTGGKRTLLDKPLYGLVLTGGKSSRMGEDKALINYKGTPHGQYTFDILSKFCEKVFLSSKENQWKGSPLENLPTITDQFDGPIGGILSAFEAHPDVNWFIVACDLIHFNEKTVEKILSHAEDKVAVCFKNKEKGFPEPLCALYSPKAKDLFKNALSQDITCPVKVLRKADLTLLDQNPEINLANINTPEERHEHH